MFFKLHISFTKVNLNRIYSSYTLFNPILSRSLVIKNWAPMPEVIYEVPDNFKNIVVGLYIFGWLFVGFVSIAYAALTQPIPL